MKLYHSISITNSVTFGTTLGIIDPAFFSWAVEEVNKYNLLITPAVRCRCSQTSLLQVALVFESVTMF